MVVTPRKSTLRLNCQSNKPPSLWNIAFTRNYDLQTMVIQTWVFDRHFLENKWSATVVSMKITEIFIGNDEIWACKWKLPFGKIALTTVNLAAFQHFSGRIDGDIKKHDFKILHNENIWKIYTTQWTNFFFFFNPFMGKRSIQKLGTFCQNFPPYPKPQIRNRYSQQAPSTWHQRRCSVTSESIHFVFSLQHLK